MFCIVPKTSNMTRKLVASLNNNYKISNKLHTTKILNQWLSEWAWVCWMWSVYPFKSILLIVLVYANVHTLIDG